MSVILIEDGVVLQKWEGKTLDHLKEKYPNADLRESDAECGQIDNGDGTFKNPDPIPEDPAEVAKRAQAKALWQSITTGTTEESLIAIKTLLKPLLRGYINEQ